MAPWRKSIQDRQNTEPRAPFMPATSPLAPVVPHIKVSPPVASRPQVVRRAIAEMLREAPAARLVVVRGPAGFGKTTAMLQYMARLKEAAVATAWLTLDSADNDGTRFLAGLETALEQIVPDRGATQAVDAAPRAIGDVAMRLMDRLCAAL